MRMLQPNASPFKSKLFWVASFCVARLPKRENSTAFCLNAIYLSILYDDIIHHWSIRCPHKSWGMCTKMHFSFSFTSVQCTGLFLWWYYCGKARWDLRFALKALKLEVSLMSFRNEFQSQLPEGSVSCIHKFHSWGEHFSCFLLERNCHWKSWSQRQLGVIHWRSQVWGLLSSHRHESEGIVLLL